MYCDYNMYLTTGVRAVPLWGKNPVAYKKNTRWYSMADRDNSLLLEHLPLIKKFIKSISGRMDAPLSDEEADDIQQDVIERLLKKGMKEFRGECKFSTYLFKVVHNSIRDYIKSRNKVTSVDTDDHHIHYHPSMMVDDFSSSIIDTMKTEDIMEIIHNEVKSMKEELRLIFHWYFMEKYTQVEVARMMRKSQSTIAEHIENIRRTLTRAVKGRYPEMKKGIH